MAIQNITFNLQNGNLGKTLPGQDYISGFLIYSSTVPSGFTSSVAKAIYSVAQAESLGILGDYSDEVKATASIAITATGSVGDIFTIKITEPSINQTTNIVNIPYTRQTNDTTTTLLASSIASTVNASGTSYAATSTTSNIVLTARPGMGISLNSGSPLSVTASGSIAGNVSANFANGVASNRALWRYQISEYFRLQPNGVLWVGFYPTSDTTFASLATMQSQANGAIRQFMIQSTATSTSTMLSELDLIQTQANTLFNNYTPASVLYSPNFYSITDLSTLPNIRSKNDPKVSVIIGQDAGSLGAFLSISSGKSVPTLGAALGAVSLSKVSEDIAWVSKFNISNGTEDETIGFINNTSTNLSTWNSVYGNTKSLLTQLDNYGYIFLKKLNNVSGSYFNDSHCAVSVTSNYAYIENNRVIDKVVRNSYLELSPLIAGPVYFNSDGTLSDISISNFEDSVKPSLDAMVQAGEISAYKINVDPRQNVQATSNIVVTIQIVGVGVSRNITVNLSYALSI